MLRRRQLLDAIARILAEQFLVQVVILVFKYVLAAILDELFIARVLLDHHRVVVLHVVLVVGLLYVTDMLGLGITQGAETLT